VGSLFRITYVSAGWRLGREDQEEHSVLAYVELQRLVRNTEVRFDYDYS